MLQILIIYPLMAMAALTFGVGILMIRLRFLAVRRGEINPRYFLLNRGSKVPDYLAQVEQNYHNLLELPLLFYAVSILLFLTSKVDVIYLALAWSYVGMRLLHTLIHTTVNRLRMRMWAFLLSSVLLIAIWLRLSLQLALL
ncbi:MAG: MAPEG family protein [gamma proteobacterium endosymbiont of Lamellibrachia anaximandri]|nr:MAPEG family protein [gamma proteobacterium endosymbiont of Lamellibrachia anaximandri]MBL3533100.1 MAPEG family protein [gamma proteobacterium endosymbiont of Lamellibrachia anaximandri]